MQAGTFPTTVPRDKPPLWHQLCSSRVWKQFRMWEAPPCTWPCARLRCSCCCYLAASHAQQHLGEGAVLALHKTHDSWLFLLVPTAHPSLPLFPPLQTFAASGALQTPPIPPQKFEFYLFQSTKRKPWRKIRSTLAALRLHQYFFSSLFCCTFCTAS